MNTKIATALVAFVSVGVIGIVGYKSVSANKKRKNSNQCVEKISEKSNSADVIEDTADKIVEITNEVVIDVVNASRISELLKEIETINKNEIGAQEEIGKYKEEIIKILKSNRGGGKGIHGFIGEISQVRISNVKAYINGNEPLYILKDDNSMVDYLRGMQIIQQKACQSDGVLGLSHIKAHADKYPEFIEEGGIYQIPKDMFEKYYRLRNMSEEVAQKLRKEELRIWRYIRSYTEENPKIVIKPMEVTYSDIQVRNIRNTIGQVEKNAEREFENQRKEAHKMYAPSFKEFIKVCSVSAVIEGSISAGGAIIQKLRERKKIRNFTKQDIKYIFKKLFVGSGRGYLRSAIMYFVTNILKVSATVASGFVSAIFGIVQQGYLFFVNRITKHQFRKNTLCIFIEAMISTVCSVLGKKLYKKHPMIGVIAGNVISWISVKCIQRQVFA